MRLKALAVTFLTLSTLASAASLDVFLGGAGYECLSTPGNCGGDPTYQWTNGDYVGQTVTGTGFGFINQIDLALLYSDFLQPAFPQTYDVVINGTTVGNFTIVGLHDFNDYTLIDSFSFAPIAGPDFTVLFRMSSADTPDGEGSIGWYHGGADSYFTISDDVSRVPEPGTFALMLPAVAGLWAIRRRKR